MRLGPTVALLGLLWLGSPAIGAAQGTPAGVPPGRWEVAAGGAWFTSASPAEGAATLRTRDGSDFALFNADAQVRGGPALDVRAGYAFSRRFIAEARFGFSRPRFEASISGDAEGAPPILLEERLDRYVIDGALVAMVTGLSAGRVVPFVSAGAGYVRQLHEGRTLVEQGMAYHAGGGVKQTFLTRNAGLLKAAGVRADVRVYILSFGDDDTPAHGSFSAAVFFRF